MGFVLFFKSKNIFLVCNNIEPCITYFNATTLLVHVPTTHFPPLLYTMLLQTAIRKMEMKSISQVSLILTTAFLAKHAAKKCWQCPSTHHYAANHIHCMMNPSITILLQDILHHLSPTIFLEYHKQFHSVWYHYHQPRAQSRSGKQAASTVGTWPVPLDNFHYHSQQQ